MIGISLRSIAAGIVFFQLSFGSVLSTSSQADQTFQIASQITSQATSQATSQVTSKFRDSHPELKLPAWSSSSGPYSPELRKLLSERHIVFVDGVLNELAHIGGFYFRDNIKEIKEIPTTYSHLGYSSANSISENGTQLKSDLLNIYEQVKRPIILIGHSMGGAESLYAVLEFPSLILDGIVEKVVLIQPAIGGSPLANGARFGWLGKRLQSPINGSLKSMTRIQSFYLFHQAHQDYYASLTAISEEMAQTRPGIHATDLHREISDRIFYVRSALPSDERLGLGIRLCQFLCKDEFPSDQPNDGMLSTQAQMLSIEPPIGQDLGILHGDHAEFVIAGFTSRSNKATRQAFTRALLKAIYPEFSEIRH